MQVSQLIEFGTKLCRQIVGTPMGTNCAPLEADLFLTATKEIPCIFLTMTIKLILSMSLIRRHDTLMTYPYLEGMVNQFHPHELKLNTANPKPPFWINFFLLQINLFLLSFMINAMTLVLI